MNEDNKIKDLEANEQSPESKEVEPGDLASDEFKITIRKLERPVQPRGVLAE
jgi:hypothetical protein